MVSCLGLDCHQESCLHLQTYHSRRLCCCPWLLLPLKAGRIGLHKVGPGPHQLHHSEKWTLIPSPEWYSRAVLTIRGAGDLSLNRRKWQSYPQGLACGSKGKGKISTLLLATHPLHLLQAGKSGTVVRRVGELPAPHPLQHSGQWSLSLAQAA